MDKSGSVDLSRTYYFEVVPPFLVARIISRLYKNGTSAEKPLTRQYQDGLWRNGALLHDNERQSVGLLLLEQKDEHVEGTLMVRTQSSSQIVALTLLDHICDTIQECLELSPGVESNDLLECRDCQTDCRQRLDQIASDVANVDIAVSVGNEPKIRCTRHYLNVYSPRAILEKGGHVTPFSENVPSAMLPYSDIVLQEMCDSLEKMMPQMEKMKSQMEKMMYIFVKACIEAQLAANYPNIFLPVPSNNPQKWSTTSKSQLFLLPLCEFAIADKKFFHPVPGAKPKKLKGNLQNIPEGLRNSMTISSQGIVKYSKIHKLQKPYFQKLLGKVSAENDLVPKRLSGKALEIVQKIFGDHLVKNCFPLSSNKLLIERLFA